MGAIAASLAITTPNVAHTTEEASPKQSVLTTEHFTTPSGKIQCQVTIDDLRCEFSSGQLLRPAPRRPQNCDLDWGSGLVLGHSGSVEVLCAGDTIRLPRDHSTTLAYGRTWKRGSFTCKVQRVGLTCTNGSRRGFFLSTQRWRAIN